MSAGLFKLFEQIEFLPVISDGQDARSIGMLNSVRLVGGHADRSNRLLPLLPALSRIYFSVAKVVSGSNRGGIRICTP